MSTKIFRCMDIWTEILNLFEVSLESDEKEVIKEKRKTLLTIALVSRELTELALDMLWKNMSSLFPVAVVSGSQRQFLLYPSEGTRCLRLVCSSGIMEPSRMKMLQYLKRIRKFHVQISEQELELWQILHAILLPNSFPYLLPRLQSLRLVRPATSTRIPFLGVVSYIFAPSITSITMEGAWSADAWFTIQNLMGLHHLPNLSKLFYLNLGTNSFPPCMPPLTGLRHLIHRSSNRFIPIQEIYPLRRLKKLSLNVHASREDKDSPATFPELEDLKLDFKLGTDFGSTFRCVKTPALKSLSFTIRNGWSEKLPLEMVVSGCPDLRRLEMKCDKRGKHTYQGTMNDLGVLLKVSQMKSFKLIDVPYVLTEDNVCWMVGEWLKLRTLVIRAPQTEFSASILVSIAQAPSLRRFEIPLDFSLLASDLSIKEMAQSNSPMLDIVSPSSVGIPQKGSGKLILIRNLLHLFPNLQAVLGEGEYMDELRDLLKGLRGTFYHTSESIDGSTSLIIE